MIPPVEQASAKQADTAGGDIDSMTKAELLAYAERHGIEDVNSAMLKADILAAIKGAV